VVATELASAIEINSSIKELRLRGNKLTTKGIVILARALSNLSTVKSLNIRDNQVTEEAADHLASVIQNNKKHRVVIFW